MRARERVNIYVRANITHNTSTCAQRIHTTQVNHVKIDSAVFRLHTNATVVLLVTFSIAVTTRQYVGNPIDCVHTR